MLHFPVMLICDWPWVQCLFDWGYIAYRIAGLVTSQSNLDFFILGPSHLESSLPTAYGCCLDFHKMLCLTSVNQGCTQFAFQSTHSSAYVAFTFFLMVTYARQRIVLGCSAIRATYFLRGVEGVLYCTTDLHVE